MRHEAVDSVCDDGAFCNGAEACNPEFGCVGGTAPVLDDGIACTTDTCNEGADRVDHAAVDSVCDDGAFCNGEESCSATLGCQSGTAPTVSDGIACTTDSCNEGANRIDHVTVNSACDDGAFCNGSETCSATLGCQSGTAPLLTDGISCTTDTCNEGADRVDHTPVDSACDDGAFCNGEESCSASLGCQDGTAPTVGDGIACTTDSCNEAADRIDHTPVNSTCDDGAFCNGTETCSATLGCQDGTAPTVSDGVSCTTDSCNESADRIDHVAVDSACDDGAFCNGTESCSTTLGCQAGTSPTLSDGVACTTDSCNEGADRVDHTPVNAACDDGAFCNGSETCSATLGCQSGTAPTVSDGIDCTTDSCNESANRVDHTPVNSVCDDGAFCNGDETCNVSAGCIPGSAPVLDDSVSCTLDSCNEATNQVVHTPDAGSCDDGLYCNGVESCDTGSGCESPGTGNVVWEMRTAGGVPVAGGTDQVGCSQSVMVLDDPSLCSGGVGYQLTCSFSASGELSAVMDGQGVCVSFTGSPVTSGCSNASIFASCCFDE